MNPIQLLTALVFAADKHRHQRRKDADASPHINHPILVATVLAAEGGVSDETMPVAAVLHDTVEDTDTTFEELAETLASAFLSTDSLRFPVPSAIARAKQIAWNTVDRWLERAAGFCRRFNHQKFQRLNAFELQADEIQTFVGSKEQPPVWIFVSIEFWSRLWPSTVVGKRSYRNTVRLFRDVSKRMQNDLIPRITTDGFKCYRTAVKRIFTAACLYGQVIKIRRKDRVVKVESKIAIGPPWRWQEAWRYSEDSRKLNTSYVEGLNLTIRKGSAYLLRRTICHTGRRQRVNEHRALLRCH